MRILRIIARLNVGGPAIHTILLTEALNRGGFESTLVYGRVSEHEGNMDYYAADRGINQVFIKELGRELSLYNDCVALNKIYRIIKRQHPDIIHTHTAKAGALGRLAGMIYNLSHPFKKRKIRLVHSFHGHVFEGYFGMLRTKLFIFIERALGRFTAGILTVSDMVKDELVGLGVAPKDKITVIPLGLELDDFLSIPPRRCRTVNVGIIGRLVPVKNHRLFLEAAALAVRDNPGVDLKFKIIGDGELRPQLEAQCSGLKISGDVDFLGWKKDLSRVYADLDIVALTSLNEGTPVSLIEAMASARAVVATEVGGVKDLLGRAAGIGIMVKSGDPVMFARALSLLANDACLREKIGLSARDYVKNSFSRDRLVREIQEYYRRILV